MNHGYSEVYGSISGLQAASDNLRMVDEMINEMNSSDAAPSITIAEKVQSHLGLVEQLADMVVARRAYRANARMLSATDALLDALY